MLDVNFFDKKAIQDASIDDLVMFAIELEQAICSIKNQLLAYNILDEDEDKDWTLRARQSVAIKEKHLKAVNKIIGIKQAAKTSEKQEVKTRTHYFFVAAKEMLSQELFNQILDKAYFIKQEELGKL